MIIVINSDNNSNYPCAPAHVSFLKCTCVSCACLRVVRIFIYTCVYVLPYRLIVLIITYAECLTCFTRDVKLAKVIERP